MSKEEKKARIADIAERLEGLNDFHRSYIVGYIAGQNEERQRWKNKLHLQNEDETA